MAIFAAQTGVMKLDGLKCVEKNTFLHFFEDGADSVRVSRSRSAPALLRRSIEPSAFVASNRGLPNNLTKRTLADSSQRNYGVEWTEDVQTLMIRGIPCSCKRDEILKAVEELGFREQYDFFYVPMKRNRTLGYCFIGFPDPQVTKSFANAMAGYSFKGKVSSKVVTVAPASIQGMSNNFDHFKDTSVMKSEAKPLFV